MVALLQEAGLMQTTGMGVSPLTWQEIEAWLRTTELYLSVWEKLIIREMSEAYVVELNKASARDAVSPYLAPIEPEEIDRTAVASKVATVLRGFKRNPSA